MVGKRLSEKRICPAVGCKSQFTVVDSLKQHLSKVHKMKWDEVEEAVESGDHKIRDMFVTPVTCSLCPEYLGSTWDRKKILGPLPTGYSPT
jgi:hypothetical protein